jgi:Flp pilus assembly protein CpaB
MKRNMVPLLGIAFVVAIISTGVFYGLFAGKLRSSSELPGHAIVVAARDLDRGSVIQASDLRVSQVQGMLSGAYSKPEEAAGATLLASVKANEPLLEERLAPRVLDAAGSRGLVPPGMRAVSIRVTQSDGLLSLLRAGSRVDLQAVSERNAAVELRTVLENVQIVAVNPPDPSNRTPGAIVTVLTRAQDADLLALADAGSRVRVALRNPLDEGTTPHHSMALASIFSSVALSAAPAVQPATPDHSQTWDHPIQLHVRVLDVSDAALPELKSQLMEGTQNKAWRVAAFRSSDDGLKLIQRMEQKHQLEVLSGERLMAGLGRPISYRAGAKPYQLRVGFSPEWLPTGKLSLRVKPEIGGPRESGVATSDYDASLSDNSSFLIQRSSEEGSLEGTPGVSPAADPPSRLFPGRSWEHRHLIIFVTARSLQQSSPVAVARTGRGR